MTLEPLLAASPLIQIHAFAALAAFALGIFQLAAPKGTLRHRVRRHRSAMIWLFAGALLIAGIFTLTPGRIMHDVLFGR
jgi:uncharacterized membrane protein